MREVASEAAPQHAGVNGGLFAALGQLVVRYCWLVVVVWVVGIAVASATLPSLAGKIQGNNADFLPPTAPSVQAARLAVPFGSAGLVPIALVAAREAAPLTTADTAAIAALRQQLATVSGVAQVRELGRSADGHAIQVQILANVNQGMMSNQASGLVDAIRAKIGDSGLPAGLDAHLAGDLVTQVDNQEESGTTADQLQNASALFVIVLLLFVFRSLLAPLLTLVPALLSTILASRFAAVAADAGLKISPLAQMMLIVLVIGAGTDYGLFLVFRVREELRRGLAPKAAVARALARVGESITFSAATVVAALLTLLAASFALYSDLGIPVAIGLGVMLLAALTLLPALLAILGRAAFWPSRTHSGQGRTGVWGRLSARIVRRPALTLAIGVTLLAGLAIGAFGYQAGGFGGALSPPSGSDSKAGADLLTKYFPDASANPTNLIYRLRQPAWQQAQTLVNAGDQLSRSGLFKPLSGPLGNAGASLTPAQFDALYAQLGPPNALPVTPPSGGSVPVAQYEAYRATANYISPDGRTIRFAAGLTAGGAQTTAAMNAIPQVRAQSAAVGRAIGAADWGVSGQAPSAYDISDVSGSDLWRVIPLAILVIGVLLALVLRSLIAPPYLIASVALSYLAALGLAVLLFLSLGGSDGLTFALPFMMFVFLLALGEDYNILLMTRIREEAHRLRLRDAVEHALNTTGTTVTSAGLVLAGTFGVFALVGGRGPNGGTVFDVAIGLAIGVLMDTFLVRTLLVPSTVLLLGRWNWWPSRLGTQPGPAAPVAAPADTEAGLSQPSAAERS